MRTRKKYKLEDVELFSPRPGVVNLITKDTKEYVASISFFCQDCFTVSAKLLDYWVDTNLWKKYVPENGVLCLPCLEKRVRDKFEFKRLSNIKTTI